MMRLGEFGPSLKEHQPLKSDGVFGECIGGCR
jgi:hypothetical protein